MKEFGIWTQKQLKTTLGDLERVIPHATQKVSVRYLYQEFIPGGVIEGFRMEMFEAEKGAGQADPSATTTPDRRVWKQVIPTPTPAVDLDTLR